jgi:hypothetical protein
MNQPEAQCQDLVDKTAASIGSDILQLLFVSVQQVNIKTCIQYAVADYWKKSTCPIWLMQDNVAVVINIIFVADLHRGLKLIIGWDALFWDLMKWFPHIWVSHTNEY